MADNDNIRGDDYGFDNIDSDDNGFDGDEVDFEGGGGSQEYNGGGYEFDGGSGGNGDDFGVFNFREEDDQSNAIMLVPPVDDKLRDIPRIQTFSIAEGLRQVPHGDTMVVANSTIDKVEPSQPMSDSVDFGDADKGGNVHQECNPYNVELLEHLLGESRLLMSLLIC